VGQWLGEKENTIYVTAEDGKQYAFYPRKTDPTCGHILVKGPDGRRYGVTGDRVGDRFVTNPLGKNALAVLNPKQIDEAKGLPPVVDVPANNLAKPGENIE
jgi:hypothetical protein